MMLYRLFNYHPTTRLIRASTAPKQGYYYYYSTLLLTQSKKQWSNGIVESKSVLAQAQEQWWFVLKWNRIGGLYAIFRKSNEERIFDYMKFLNVSFFIFLFSTPYCFDAHCESSDNNGDLKKRLMERLKPIRTKMKSNPSVKLQLSKDGSGCKYISFTLPNRADAVKVAGVFIKAIEEETKDAIKLDIKNDEIEASLTDGSGNIVIAPTAENSYTAELVLFKENGVFSDTELDAFSKAYEVGAFSFRGQRFMNDNFFDLSNSFPEGGGSFFQIPQQQQQQQQVPGDKSGDPIKDLEALGAIVYNKKGNTTSADMDWNSLAGYENIKMEIEDTVLLGLKHPQEFDNVTKLTRENFESNRPRALLFDGPPGTGKTTTARIIANQASVPMIYVPIESVMSKWFGESEQHLSKILKICDENFSSAIIFLDEIDSLATSRSSGDGMHEATRRLLSVLLRTLDGFQNDSQNSILIAATNRKQDLDPALISRFDLTLSFPLPNEKARVAILGRYAKHLSKKELEKLAQKTEGFSGRDLKDVCKRAERRWVSKLLRGSGAGNTIEELEIQPPPIEYYLESIYQRSTQLF